MNKILVIEDDLNVLENIVEILEMNDYEVVQAKNGHDGIAAAYSQSPELIICDVMMPGADGYEVLGAVRKNPATFYIPFLFLTAKSAKIDQRRGMELGADDYITKPYRNAEILNAVRIRIEKAREIKKASEANIEELRQNISTALPHEFRTPLNGIYGFVQLLKYDFESLNDEEKKFMIDNIFESTERLNKLIQNFIYFNELLVLKSRNKSVGQTEISPKSTIIEQSQIIAEKYERYDDLQYDLVDNPIEISDVHFTRAVQNLIDNAFKFSQAGTRVALASRIESGKYIFDVTNFGEGLEQNRIDMIGAFGQFGRSIHEQQGMGLGLAIVKLICEIYNGRFEIISQPGEDFTGRMIVPLNNS
ncbi:MAG: response regulator [Candidatus Kapaibacterium sp.]